MTSLLEKPTMSDAFSDTPVGLLPTIADPRHLCPNTLKASQGDKLSPVESLYERKTKPERGLCPNQEYKLHSQSARKTRRSSKRYSSRAEASPERVRHLERNRIAASRCRIKRNSEQRQIQSVLDSEITKHETLLTEVNVLKEMAWHLKNHLFEHATKCGDQQISQYLTLAAQDVPGVSTAWLQCPPSTFSIHTWSRSVDDEDSGGTESNRLYYVAGTANECYPDDMFDRIVDVPHI